MKCSYISLPTSGINFSSKVAIIAFATLRSKSFVKASLLSASSMRMHVLAADSCFAIIASISSPVVVLSISALVILKISFREFV